jgi:hypothetical protein
MRKLRLLLALIVASICSVHSAWARTAPTAPSSETLEAGGKYYVYNTAVDAFIGSNGKSDTGIPVTFVENGNQYCLQNESGQWLRRRITGGVPQWYNCSWDASYSNRTSLTVETSEDSENYWIYSGDDAYINFLENESDLRAYFGRSGSQVWRLVAEANVEGYRMYAAKMALYKALSSTDGSGFNFDKYEAVYNNPNSTAEELYAAASATTLVLQLSSGIAKHELHEYPITLFGVGGGWNVNGYHHVSKRLTEDGSNELVGLVTLPQNGTLVYKNNTADYQLKVYVDGELVKSLSKDAISETHNEYFYIDLPAGSHEIAWRFEGGNAGYYSSLEMVGVFPTPLIAVELSEAGQLGTEVLYQTDDLKTVRYLKVSGPMNSDDWAKIGMMTTLFKLDLTDADIKSIPGNAFAKDQNYRTACAENLYWLKLPTKLESIANYQFAHSLIEDLEIPASVTSIGENAFVRSFIRKADLSSFTSISSGAFSNCSLLEKVTLSDQMESIGSSAFYGCFSIKPQTIQLPATLSYIGSRAFEGCSSLNFRLPDRTMTLGREAFYGTAIDSLIIRNTINFESYNGEYNFENLPMLVYVEYPVSMYNNLINGLGSASSRLNTIRINSATVGIPLKTDLSLANIKLIVPDYLVNSYKLDSYWYTAKSIEGFSTAEIQNWTVNRDLTMSDHQRFEGSPDVTLNAGWKLNGSSAQNINNLTVNRGNGIIFCNGENVRVNGTLTLRKAMDAKAWYYLSLPFDVKVGDINTGGAQVAVRYYDGAHRADNGTSGNWKNYAAADVITAGTGFVIQVSKAATVTFTALENDAKQNIVSNNIFEKPLQANNSASQANKGWNLVGNPWQSYYNIHKLNFTAPITVWNGSSYAAYSIIDDDYAIAPNDAFFVQCPDEISTISFPIDGRQLTSVIESQNGARATAPAERTLVDVELSNGELTDKTRFVLNPEASLAYELNCDAAKFFSTEGAVPQLYTVEQGLQLAINERPQGNGTVQIGFKVSADGSYTLAAPRCQFESIVLVDHETGTETELAGGESYTFTAEAGTNESRFTLRIGGALVTGVESVALPTQQEAPAYNLNGQRIAVPQKGLYIKNGKKVIIK